MCSCVRTYVDIIYYFVGLLFVLHRRIEEIEARIDEAYKKTLAAKEERIAGLEKRLMEASSANDSLQMEVSLMKKQSKVQRLNSSPMSSPAGSPYTSRQEKTKSLM